MRAAVSSHPGALRSGMIDEGTLLRRIEARVAAYAGLKPPAWVLASRVDDRVRRLGLAGRAEYASLLEGERGQAELVALAECLRVGETCFYRHRAHVRALQRVVAPDLAVRRRTERYVRAWSAGCATGEEAYTLAIVLGEALPKGSGFRIEVLGTDISEPALEFARARTYPPEALRAVPPDVQRRFFVEAGGRFRVVDAIAERVRFARLNLLGGPYPRALDVILCRNVLIYFEAGARRRTIERLIEALAPGGYLFLGYAESLREFETLEALHTPDGVIYRKPLVSARMGGPAAASPRPPSRFRPKAPPSWETDRAARRRAARETRSGHGRLGPTEPPDMLVPPDAPGSHPTPRACAEEAPPFPLASSESPSPDAVVRLRGSYEDPAVVTAELRRAMGARVRRVVVELDEVDFLADEVASVLRRASAAAQAEGVAFALRATRPGPRRWLSRHGLLELTSP